MFQAVECGQPPDIPHGMYTLNNDEASYACDPGYRMSSHVETLKCDVYGNWGTQIPICEGNLFLIPVHTWTFSASFELLNRCVIRNMVRC